MKELSFQPVYCLQPRNAVEMLNVVSDHSQPLADSLPGNDKDSRESSFSSPQRWAVLHTVRLSFLGQTNDKKQIQ